LFELPAQFKMPKSNPKASTSKADDTSDFYEVQAIVGRRKFPVSFFLVAFHPDSR
jgi:hypothetical protein